MGTTPESKTVQLVMNYTEAINAVRNGESVRRIGWGECKTIRMAVDSDQDHFVHEVNLLGAIMEDCSAPKCDCQVGIWAQPAEDKNANDWVIA